jgi:glutamine amidotransferase
VTSVVHVVDYGVGNLYSVARAIEKAGGEPRLSGDASEIAAAGRLVLPGVGAFENGMRGLRAGGLDEAVLEFARAGRPLLGICLGMQMLATESSEFGQHGGLDLIPGQVLPIPSKGVDGAPHKIPFIGWVELEAGPAGKFDGTPLSAVPPGGSVYLVHSFHLEPTDPGDLLAVYRYDGVSVTAAVGRGNVLGCQFHPEKSGPAGLRILQHFLAW